jgi:hypothetical protein
VGGQTRYDRRQSSDRPFQSVTVRVSGRRSASGTCSTQVSVPVVKARGKFVTKVGSGKLDFLINNCLNIDLNGAETEVNFWLERLNN